MKANNNLSTSSHNNSEIFHVNHCEDINVCSEISKLPDELILKIFSQLQFEELLALGLTCRRFRLISTDKEICKNFRNFLLFLPPYWIKKTIQGIFAHEENPKISIQFGELTIKILRPFVQTSEIIENTPALNFTKVVHEIQTMLIERNFTVKNINTLQNKFNDVTVVAIPKAKLKEIRLLKKFRVGVLKTTKGKLNYVGCAVKISPDWILTTTYNVCSESQNRASEGNFYPVINDDYPYNDKDVGIEVKGYRNHPSYPPKSKFPNSEPELDFAIMQLANDYRGRKGYVPMMALSNEQWESAKEIILLDSKLFPVFQRKFNVIKRTLLKITEHEIYFDFLQTGMGMGGSGIFIKRDNQLVLVAIYAYGESSMGIGLRLTQKNIDSINDSIKKFSIPSAQILPPNE